MGATFRLFLIKLGGISTSDGLDEITEGSSFWFFLDGELFESYDWIVIRLLSLVSVRFIPIGLF